MKKLPNAYLIPGIPNSQHVSLGKLMNCEQAVDKILSIVSRTSKIPVDKIRRRLQYIEILPSRYVAMYLCAKYLNEDYSLKEIHFRITRRELKQGHTSLMHSKNQVQDAIDGNLRGPLAESILELLQITEFDLTQFIYESNCANWKSRQR